MTENCCNKDRDHRDKKDKRDKRDKHRNKCCGAIDLARLRRESQIRRPARQRRVKVGSGSGTPISKSGTVMNAAITHNAANKVTNVCGCRTRPVSSSFFNST